MRSVRIQFFMYVEQEWVASQKILYCKKKIWTLHTIFLIFSIELHYVVIWYFVMRCFCCDGDSSGKSVFYYEYMQKSTTFDYT